MKIITIKSQKEFDSLPKEFAKRVTVKIKDCYCVINRHITNARVEGRGKSYIDIKTGCLTAYDKCHVFAKNNSTVIAKNNSNIIAKDCSKIDARDNAIVTALDNSHVEARDNVEVTAKNNSNILAKDNAKIVAMDYARIIAKDNANIQAKNNTYIVALNNCNIQAKDNTIVKAEDNANVTALHNVRVIAWDNSCVNAFHESQVKAYRQSKVIARDNSKIDAWNEVTVQAFDKSIVSVWSPSVVIEKLLFFSTLILYSNKCKILKKHITANVVYYKEQNITNEMFCDMLENTEDGYILYKSVDPKTYCDFYTGKIKYEIGKTVTCPNFNSDETKECGEGLHLSPTKEQALIYNPDGKILKCAVKKNDFVIYQKDYSKVRCKKIKVLEEIWEEK